MSRPKKPRIIQAKPPMTSFKPCGMAWTDLTEVYIPLEGFEAIRLTDVEGCSQAEAAEFMGVSRHTFGRILAQARHAMGVALVEGHALTIRGGAYNMAGEDDTPPRRYCAPRPDISRTVAVCAQGPGLESPVDFRFGRCAGFSLIDPLTMDTRWLDNGLARDMEGGAGIQAAEMVAEAGAGAVLAGVVGPKALRVLERAGIVVVQDVGETTVDQALRDHLARWDR